MIEFLGGIVVGVFLGAMVVELRGKSRLEFEPAPEEDPDEQTISFDDRLRNEEVIDQSGIDGCNPERRRQ